MSAPEPARPAPAPRPAGLVLTPEEQRRRRARMVATALLLGALCVMFYLVTIAKLGPGIVTGRPL